MKFSDYVVEFLYKQGIGHVFCVTGGKERPDHFERYLEERCPAHRFGTTQEIAHSVVFACSQQASFSQGAVVPVDGGQIRGFLG